MKSYNEALALQREIGDKSGTSITLINLGALLNEGSGRPDEALPLFREALSLAREAGDRGGEALALNNIGVGVPGEGRVLRGADLLRAGARHPRAAEGAARNRRHPPQPRRDARQDGQVRPGARALPASALDAAPGRRRHAHRGHGVVQHRHDLRLPGPLRRGGQVEGRGAAGVSRPEAAGRLARRDPERHRLQPRARRPRGRVRRSTSTRRWPSRAN